MYLEEWILLACLLAFIFGMAVEEFGEGMFCFVA